MSRIARSLPWSTELELDWRERRWLSRRRWPSIADDPAPTGPAWFYHSGPVTAAILLDAAPPNKVDPVPMRLVLVTAAGRESWRVRIGLADAKARIAAEARRRAGLYAAWAGSGAGTPPVV